MDAPTAWPSNQPAYQHNTTLNVLGTLVSDNNDPKPDFSNVEGKVWAAVRNNCSPSFSTAQNISLLRRCARPVLTSHATTWPLTKELLTRMDRLQNKAIKSTLHFPRDPLDNDTQFHSRLNHHIRSLTAKDKKWSSVVTGLQGKWNEHLRRHPGSLPSRLMAWRDEDWLANQRLQRGLTSVAGRTGTRLPGLGTVHKRWQTGLREAQETRPQEPLRLNTASIFATSGARGLCNLVAGLFP